MDEIDISYRGLEELTSVRVETPQFGPDAYMTVPDREKFRLALLVRGAVGRRALARLESWMIFVKGYAEATAKRKRRLVWAARCDYGDAIWDKALRSHDGERSLGAKAWTYICEIKRALRDYCEWELEDPESDDEDRAEVREILEHLKYNVADVEAEIAFRAARANPKRAATLALKPKRPKPERSEPERSMDEEAKSRPQRSTAQRKKKPPPDLESLRSKDRLDYRELVVYSGYSIRYLRNLVSADAIPVVGPPGARRFPRDLIDYWLTDREAAMRKFRQERQAHHGD